MNIDGDMMGFQGNIKLNQLEAGKRGLSVLLLHGLNESFQGYRPVIEYLKPHIRLYALDFRGHGLSPRMFSYQLRDYAADIIGFIETETEPPIILAGHSLGGLVAAFVAESST